MGLPMHTTRTFILRLFIDLESLENLRGSVQSLTEKDPRPFASEKMLGVLLRQMIIEASREKSSSPEA